MKRDGQARSTRVWASLGCLAATALLVILLFGMRSGGFLCVNQARDSKISLKTLIHPETDRWLWNVVTTNDIPLLTEALDTEPNSIDSGYALAWSNTPLAIRSRLSLPLPFDPAAAINVHLKASALLGSRKIAEFVPASVMLKELRDSNSGVRMNALAGLNNGLLRKSGPKGLGEEKETIFLLILGAAQDPEMKVRMSAVLCLQYFKEAPDQVIPILSKAMTDSFPDVRIRAAMAFYEFDPERAEKAGALTTAFECLHGKSPHGAGPLASMFLKEIGKLPPDVVE